MWVLPNWFSCFFKNDQSENNTLYDVMMMLYLWANQTYRDMKDRQLLLGYRGKVVRGSVEERKIDDLLSNPVRRRAPLWAVSCDLTCDWTISSSLSANSLEKLTWLSPWQQECPSSPSVVVWIDVALPTWTERGRVMTLMFLWKPEVTVLMWERGAELFLHVSSDNWTRLWH